MPALAATRATPSRPSYGGGGDLRDAILQAFPARLVDESSPALDPLVALLRLYESNLNAEDLFFKTEAILTSTGKDRVTRETVDQLRSSIQAEWENRMRSGTGAHGGKAAQTPASKPKASLGSLFGVQTPRTPVTPSAAPHYAQVRSLDSNDVTPSGGARQVKMELDHPSPVADSGQILETLNGHLPSVEPANGPDVERTALVTFLDPQTYMYRYMFERPGIKGQALDDGLERISAKVLHAYGLSDDDIADPAVTSQENVFVVGRIAPALSAEEKEGTHVVPKLKDGLVLEVSRRIGACSRTPLRLARRVKLQALPSANGQALAHTSGTGGQLGLFPGMVAGFRGRNGGGDAFVVEEIFMPPALPLPVSPVKAMLEAQYDPRKLNGGTLQVFIASGPFTLDSDLNFTPWHRLMDQVERRRPDVLILMGPFLPASHAGLLDPNLEKMPDECFEDHISARLGHLCKTSKRTRVILMPSTRDIVSAHAAWPQPMFDKAALNIHPNVKSFPNPSVFALNGVLFGASTADVLRDMRSDELTIDVHPEGEQTTTNRDPVSRAVRQLLHQQHYYPLYPASSATELPLDVTHAELGQFGEVTPDVLLLPSMLAPLARLVDGTVVVNPGAAAKGSTDGRGTYAVMQIAPIKKQELLRAIEQHQQDDVMSRPPAWKHVAYERTRVDITRL